MQAFLPCIARNFYYVFAGSLVGYRWRKATHTHSGFLHGMGTVGEKIVVGILTTDFEGHSGIIFDYFPTFRIHNGVRLRRQKYAILSSEFSP